MRHLPTQAETVAGFSLVEALIATSLLSVALVSVASLCALSVKAAATARTTTFASILAQQKLEQLRSLSWGFDAAGLAASDRAGLNPSPAGTLAANTSGYCDFLDASGESLGGGTIAPAATVFVRRWSVDPLPERPDDTLVLQVVVARAGSFDNAARIVSVKTRTR